MLHDLVASRAAGASTTTMSTSTSTTAPASSMPAETTAATTEDRRRFPRVPFPGEIVIVWHHDLPATARYAIVDAGDGGLRIRSRVPLVEGTTGMALKLLPEGQAVDRPVGVVWSREREDGEGYEVGLRFI